MANSSPIVPVMDWTQDAELHKRYVECREEVELELGSSLSNRANSVKSNYVLRWAGKPARDYLKSLPESEYKYEGASADAILTALEKKTKSKSNEIAAFIKLHSLKQGDMPLSEFIREARRLAELCAYPNDQDRLIRDMIVSGVYSLRAYQKCINAKDLSLQDCINICQVEDAIRMQVQESRPESVNSIQSAQTMIPVQRLQHGSKQSSNFNNSTRISLHETAIIREHQTGPESTPRYVRLRTPCVVSVARRGTLTHFAEAAGHPYTSWRHKTTAIHSLKSLHKTIIRVQRLHNTPHHTSYPEKSYHKQNATASRLYESPDWVPMSRVSISDQHGLHSLRTLRSIKWLLKLTQGQVAM